MQSTYASCHLSRRCTHYPLAVSLGLCRSLRSGISCRPITDHAAHATRYQFLIRRASEAQTGFGDPSDNIENPISNSMNAALTWCEDPTLLSSMFSLNDFSCSQLQAECHIRDLQKIFNNFVDSLQVGYSTISGDHN